jgi:hypothetical protein
MVLFSAMNIQPPRRRCHAILRLAGRTRLALPEAVYPGPDGPHATLAAASIRSRSLSDLSLSRNNLLGIEELTVLVDTDETFPVKAR